MADQSYRIARVTDTKIHKVFKDIADKWGFDNGSAELLGLQAKCGFKDEPSPHWAQVLQEKGYLA